MCKQQEQKFTVVNSELEQVLTPILARLDSVISDSQNLLVLLNEQKLDAALAKISVFFQSVSDIEEAQKPILAQLEHAYSVEMLDNLRDILERIQQALINFEQASDDKIAADFMGKAQFLCEFQLIPMLRNTRTTFYFWGCVNRDDKLLKQYYATEYAQTAFNPYVASGNPLPYQVSVVVVAYNKLDMTKRCLESILANTDFERLQAELILVDHGSNDGTLEYFESIPNAKVLHFKNNILVSLFPMLPQICLSPFYVHVANDTVVTKDWLDILLACMKSEPNIATASPATCNIANYQDLCVPSTNDYEEIVELAKLHNKINPLLWNERAQVLPAIGIFSIPVLNQIGFWDPAFYNFYSSDNDFCFTARRAGFKMILCEDVFCFHQGQGTFHHENREMLKLLEQSSRIFKQKNGVDQNGVGSCYNLVEVELLQQELKNNQHLQSKVIDCNEKLNLLLINGGAGDTALQIRNILKRNGKLLDIYHLQNTSEYVDDIKHEAAGYVCEENLDFSKALKENFTQVDFSLVCVDAALEPELLTSKFVEALANRLKEGAVFIFWLKNDLHLQNVQQMMEFVLEKKPLSEWSSLPYTQINHLLSIVSQNFCIKRIVHGNAHNIGVDINHVVKLLSQFYKEASTNDYESIFLKNYWLVCQK